MSKNTDKIVNAKKISICNLFITENIWLNIPNYQRPYVWDDDNIHQFLDDLWYSFEHDENDEYFLGAIVLNELDKDKFNNYEVLDGQQRIITLMILFAVLRDLFSLDITGKSDKAKNVCHDIIYQDENEFKNIPKRNRVVFSKNNVNTFFENHIVKQGSTMKKESFADDNQRNVTIVNMSNAVSSIHSFFGEENKNKKIDLFLKYLSNHVVIIFISSQSKEDAFRMFTILNNRGVPLRGSDILKAINIEAIEGEDSRKIYAEKWEYLEEKFGENFDKFLGFIKSIILKDNLQKVDFLKSFEKEIYKDDSPLMQKGKDTIDCFEEFKNIYEASLELKDTHLNNEYKNLLTIMKIGISSEHWIPPLLAYYKKFKSYRILDFLTLLEYKCFGDWSLNIYATVKKENMNKILKEVLKTEKDNIEYLLKNDSIFYIDKDALRRSIDQDFERKNPSLARYILLKYEYKVSDNTVHLAEYERISIEHVLPRTPHENSQWLKDFSEIDRKYWTNKIANLVLLSRNKNSELSNRDFQEKKKLYFFTKADIFHGSKIYLSEDSWTKELLVRRQNEIIQKICGN